MIKGRNDDEWLICSVLSGLWLAADQPLNVLNARRLDHFACNDKLNTTFPPKHVNHRI